MAQSSRKKDRIFFSNKEAIHGTPDTTCFFEGNGTMTFPSSEPQQESDKGKLGSGEHGTRSELQAIWTPWSYTCDRMSEIAYLLSYFQGKSYAVVTSGSLEKHELFHLGVDQRTLPSFTFEYGIGGTGNNTVFAGNVVNEFSLTFAAGGNGKVEATFTGWGNKHRKVGNAFALNAAGNMSVGTFDFSSEPIVNYKCTNLWKADTALHVKASSADFSGNDLGANLVTLTNLYNSFTMTGNNGMTPDDMARAGGCGIISNWERGDRAFTLELALRKDVDNGLDTDSLIINDTQMAFELEFNGPYISGTDPYAIEFFFPVVQVMKSTEDDGSPISEAITYEIFQDSDGDAFEVFVQSQVSQAYNS